MRGGINLVHPRVEQHGNFALLPKSSGADLYAVERLFTGKIFFGQRRAFIGDFRFFADYCDGACKFLLPQLDGCLCAAMSGTNNYYVKMHLPNSAVQPIQVKRFGLGMMVLARMKFGIFFYKKVSS